MPAPLFLTFFLVFDMLLTLQDVARKPKENHKAYNIRLPCNKNKIRLHEYHTRVLHIYYGYRSKCQIQVKDYSVVNLTVNLL